MGRERADTDARPRSIWRETAVLWLERQRSGLRLRTEGAGETSFVVSDAGPRLADVVHALRLRAGASHDMGRRPKAAIRILCDLWPRRGCRRHAGAKAVLVAA